MSSATVPETRHPAVAITLAGTATITGRHLRRLTRVPALIAFATVQPVLLVVLFSYGLGGAIRPPGAHRYIDYVLPGLLVLALGFGASQTGVAVADDLASGMTDRFRSMPVPAVAVLAAVALAVAAGMVFSFINILLGLLVKDPETAGLAGLFPVIILVFASSTLVPVATMPGWLQAFAKVNPVTVIGGALRVLCLGGPAATPVAQAAAWISGLLLITIPLAITRCRHAGRA